MFKLVIAYDNDSDSEGVNVVEAFSDGNIVLIDVTYDHEVS